MPQIFGTLSRVVTFVKFHGRVLLDLKTAPLIVIRLVVSNHHVPYVSVFLVFGRKRSDERRKRDARATSAALQACLDFNVPNYGL